MPTFLISTIVFPLLGSVIVTFSLGGTNDSIGAALTSLATLVDQSCQSLQYENTTLACSNALLVDGKPYGIDGYIDPPSKKVNMMGNFAISPSNCYYSKKNQTSLTK